MKKEAKIPSKETQQRRKEYHREEYSRVDDDPIMKTSELQPRLINIDQFVESRAFELKHFLKILKAKSISGGKLAFQSLPRHMRRRAMSHNYYRVPLRLRYSDTIERIKEKSCESSIRSRCRKHLRRTRLLLAKYNRRAKLGKWLETHIWHAKRFHMQKKWGYRIAEHCNDKSKRAAYRFTAHNSCIIDKSYYNWIWIKANTIETLTKALEQKLYRPIPIVTIKGKKAHDSLWINAEGKILAPVFLLFKPKGTECLICVHPASAAEIFASVESLCHDKELQAEILDFNSLCTFQMYGKTAMQVLANVLLPLAIPGQPILDLVANIEDPSIFPHNAVVGLKIRKPKNEFRMNEGVVRNPTNLVALKEADQFVYYKRDCSFSMNSGEKSSAIDVLVNWDEKLAECELWNKEYLKQLIEAQDKEIKLTTRTRFYHKKKKQNLQTLLQKFKTLRRVKGELPKIKEEVNNESEEEKFPQQTLIPLQPLKHSSTKQPMEEIEMKVGDETWVWVVIEGSKKFGAGIKLIFAAGIGLQLWRRLIYAGAKAIGLREQTAILHEKSHFVYPNDFPLTAVYDEQKQAEAFELAIEHYRKPPSKRVNYQKTGFPYPFISLWEDLIPQDTNETIKILPLIKEEFGLSPVEILMGKAYTPKERAIICIRLTEVSLKLTNRNKGSMKNQYTI